MSITVIEGVKFATAVISLVAVAMSAMYWILRHKMKEDLDKIYVSSSTCNSKHQVTDVMIKSIKENVENINDKIDMVVDFMTSKKRRK